MIDSLFSFEAAADVSPVLDRLGLHNAADQNGKQNAVQPYALLTPHRPANVDDPNAFQQIREGIFKLSQDLPIIFPVHPRTRKRIHEFGFEQNYQAKAAASEGIRLVDPLGYGVSLLDEKREAGVDGFG